MITTKFEDTYSCVDTAKAYTEKLAEVVNFLRAQTAPLTCREIGIAIFGNDYIQGYCKRSLSSRMGQILKHLRIGGFIKVEEVKCEPIEVEHEKYVRNEDKDNPQFIRVHDDEGNEYKMPNPKFNPWKAAQAGGSWQMVKETFTPTHKVYSWVAE